MCCLNKQGGLSMSLKCMKKFHVQNRTGNVEVRSGTWRTQRARSVTSLPWRLYLQAFRLVGRRAVIAQ